ncbi:LacI family transcriptional regulator [Bifidobacterium eulemuris]|nr:LacI family transcriptional regulator [Bifidobacterium eulemuris]
MDIEATGRTVTLKDVAQEAGVATMTVSKALRNQPGVKTSTRNRILAAANKLGYRGNISASALKSGKTGIIRVIVNEFDVPFYSKFLEIITTEISEKGYIPFVQKTHYSPITLQESLDNNFLADSMSDGDIIHASGSDFDQIREMSRRRPTMLVDSCTPQLVTSSVNCPNEEGMRASVQHLIDQGCTRIGLLSRLPFMTPTELMNSHIGVAPPRMRGARAAFLENGMEFTADNVIPIDGLGEEQAIEAAHRLANEGLRFDGIACMNDSSAIGLIRGLADRGISVPKDVKVMGFDGVRMGEFTVPSLSTIAVDMEQMAKLLVGQLIEQIEHPNEQITPSRTTVGFNLRKRGSTAIAS